MKVITIASIIGLIAYSLLSFKTKTSSFKSGEGITFFEGTWAQVLEKAKKENKFIFLDAYASWCGPCKMMKYKTFTDKEVGKYYNGNFLCVAVDMEIGEGPELAKKFAVNSYPTLIFLRPDGTYLGKTMGYHNPKEFVKLGEQVLRSK